MIPLVEQDGLYWMPAESLADPGAGEASALAASRLTPMQVHRTMGHMSEADLKKIGLLKSDDRLPFCDACAQGKARRQPVPKMAQPRDVEAGQCTFSDINGPMEVASLSGQRYIINFVDRATGYTCVRLMKTKDEALVHFKDCVSWMYATAGVKMGPGCVLQTDNDTVFRSRAFTEWCASQGIQTRYSSPYTQAQNGKAERNWNTILDLANTLLIDAGLPKPYWGLAVMHAVRIRNMAPASALDGAIPSERLLARPPDWSRLRRFGCPAYVHVPRGLRTKWDPKARKGIYVGFAADSKSFLVYFRDTKTVVESFHVVFDEEDNIDSAVEGVESPKAEAPAKSNEPSTPDEPAAPAASTPSTPAPSRLSQYKPTPMPSQDSDDDEGSEAEVDPLLTSYAAMDDADPHAFSAQTRLVHALTTNAMPADPANYEEAMAGTHASDWMAAVREESQAIVDNGTFVLVERTRLPKPALKSAFIFKTKLDSAGNVSRYKARLVVKGCGQRKGVDYNEIFAPVAHHLAIRTLLAIAASEGLIVEQMDVNTAFLIPEIDEEIYMELPKGWPTGLMDGDGDSSKVAKLRKSLYGLKQAPRVWHLRLSAWMLEHGFVRSESEPCLFIHRSLGMLIMVYVDDLLIGCRRQSPIDSFKKAISAAFSMKDLGVAHFCLGMRITFGSGMVQLDQERYAKQVLTRFGMADCSPTVTPLPPGTELVKAASEDELLADDKAGIYREIVGSLLYLTTCTRPDLAIAVNQLTRHMAKPSKVHLGAAKHVLRHLQGTASQGLTYRRASVDANVVAAYADASFQCMTETSKSVSGFVCLLNGAAISWRSKVQATVAMSTAEAEYDAMSLCAQEAAYLRDLMEDMGYPQRKPTTVFGDNQPAIFMTQNPATSNRFKHVVRRLKFLREQIDNGKVAIAYCPTGDMLADALTKILPRPQHSRLCSIIMGHRG